MTHDRPPDCAATAKLRPRWPVLLYVPNLIGYVRVVLCVLAFRSAASSTERFFLYYVTSFLLDGADGLAARMLRQTSRTGALLDMLTDRCATSALLFLLARHAPAAAAPLIFLDGYSHWLQMVASETAGSTSHKAATNHPLLQLYYWRPVLTAVCFFNEIALLFAYLALNGWQGPHIVSGFHAVRVVLFIASPVFVLKQVISALQIASAHQLIVESLAAS